MAEKMLTIMALGSRGDVQPYVALGGALRRAGYRVRLATFEEFAPIVAAQGLDYHHVAGDAKTLVRLAMQQNLMGTRNPLKMARAIRKTYGGLRADYERAFSDPVLRDSDAILNQLPGGLYGSDLAAALGVPHISVSVIPLVPTAAFPNPLLAAQSLGGLLNRASWGFSAQLVWGLFRPSAVQFRKAIGLRGSPPLTIGARAAGPVVNGFSEVVVPRPRDWGADVYMTGYWQLPEPDWAPDVELTEFLARGSAPVFVGFGSMIAPEGVDIYQTVVAAAQRSGVRVVLGKGWGGETGRALPETMIGVDYAPYAWLFPRMAGVVHHGGSGTTGLALHSGVPSMVAAFGADQPYWGERSFQLGVGPKWMMAQKMTVDGLAGALREMVEQAGYRERAAAVGSALRRENGLQAAVEVMGQWV